MVQSIHKRSNREIQAAHCKITKERFEYDSFFKENEGSTLIHFVNGKPHLKDKGRHDVEIHLDVSDFSSLIMGVVNFKTLFEYRLAEISDTNYLGTVNTIFITEEKPKCTTLF